MTGLRLGLSLSSIKRVFADVVGALITTADPLVTQDGNFITLQNSEDLLLIQQDWETTGDQLVSQSSEELLTQDGLMLITQKQFR